MGFVDIAAISQETKSVKKKRNSSYTKWSEKDRYLIGKYAAENGVAAAVRKFKRQFQTLNESTVRSFRKKAEEEIKQASKERREPKKALSKYSSPTGRPLLLGEFDSMVQSYLVAQSNRGCVINSSVANATATALMKRNPGVIGNIDLESSHWSQSLFRRMGFVKRRKTSSKVEIPDGARKEIEFLFHHEIVSYIEEYKIPQSLVLNLDQTPLKYVPVSNETMAKRGSTSITIEGSSDKRMITGTFAITLCGNFLPIQLIYGGSTNQSLPRVTFPKEFSLSVNPKHYSNTEESLKFLDEIIVPYVTKERSKLNLPANQKVLMIMDVFTGQMTEDVVMRYQENSILIVNVPRNMTKYYQPLDLTVNGYCKWVFKRKFNEWYSNQIAKRLADGVELNDIQVKLLLSILKPLHAGWIIEFYNEMTSSKGVSIIKSGWRASGITDAVDIGLEKLPSIDPFEEIDPMMGDNRDTSVRNTLRLTAIASLTMEDLTLAESRNDISGEDSSSEEEWYNPNDEETGRNAFDIMDDELNTI